MKVALLCLLAFEASALANTCDDQEANARALLQTASLAGNPEIRARKQRQAEDAMKDVARCRAQLKAQQERELEQSRAANAAQKAEEERRLARAREQSAREAEAQRVADAARAAAEEHQRALLADPDNMFILRGAALCVDREIRRRALGEIAAEKKYARVGGVVDRQKIYQLEQRVRWADETDAENKNSFAGQRIAPCSQPKVQLITTCRVLRAACDRSIAEIAGFVAIPQGDQ
jgi:hypothetical protein